ncbi:MAG: hypothetical protein ACLT3G_13640 [Acutalibacteraceae bacterium]
MAYQVFWTPMREEEFISLAGLDPVDAAIVRLRHKRQRMIDDIAELRAQNIILTQDDYATRIRNLKMTYDAVQPFSELLPPLQSFYRREPSAKRKP